MKLLAYVGGRVFDSVLAIWGVVTIVFVVSRLLGDPVALLLPLGAKPEQAAELRRSLELDQPIAVQYGRFLTRLLHGDFGQSFQFMQSSWHVVLDRMPASIAMAASGLLVGLLFGSAAGAVAALRRGTFEAFLIMVAALISQATPVFWLGIMLILFFGLQLGWLPTGGFDAWSGLVLPALTLGAYCAASIARLFRSSILEVLREDYVRTARAKGLRPTRLYVRHVARSASIPVVTMAGILAGELLGSSVITETVFSWPGVGRLIVQAIGAHDFPVVQAGVTVLAIVVVSLNLLTDMCYALLDPRVRRNG